MQLTEALSPRISACPPPFLPPGKGKWDTRQFGQGNPERVQKNSPSLSNSIRGHGPREVMSQLYKPPVLLAFCSGRATARGAPTSNLLTKQRICRFELNTHVTFQSVRTRRYWGSSLSRSPLILCQFRWWGRTKAEPCDTHTRKTMQAQEGLLKQGEGYARLSSNQQLSVEHDSGVSEATLCTELAPCT